MKPGENSHLASGPSGSNSNWVGFRKDLCMMLSNTYNATK